jgi:NAD(P)-dependent dehydrogenase (short-subunit alcohol dehydrogenase family)
LVDGGRIIFMSSIAARIGVANHALYAGSKSAVEGFARSFAADGGPRRITANAIAPGGIKTDMFKQNAWHYSPGATKDTPIETIEAGIAKLIPLGRCAVPEDISKVVMFLCHPDSEWINGKFSMPVVTARLLKAFLQDKSSPSLEAAALLKQRSCRIAWSIWDTGIQSRTARGHHSLQKVCET